MISSRLSSWPLVAVVIFHLAQILVTGCKEVLPSDGFDLEAKTKLSVLIYRDHNAIQWDSGQAKILTRSTHFGI